MSKLVFQNACIATMECDASVIPAMDVVINGELIEAVQRTGTDYGSDYQLVDSSDTLLTPGLIDCHTHLVYAGSRAVEWQKRLAGASYAEIAAGGGGICSTVNATRNAGFEDLLCASRSRAGCLMKEGVTTLEIKSGYGLDLATERKQLQVAEALHQELPLSVSKTLLAAHTVPPECSSADEYIEEVVNHIIPQLVQEGLVDAVDVFCENVGFTLDQSERVFKAAQKAGRSVKGHMEQFSNLGGSALVARYGGLSSDHLEELDEKSVLAMRDSNTVAVLLPLAYYFLNMQKPPPVGLMRSYGINIAVATDYNPGTAPILSLRQAMNMAAVLYGLTIDEVWLGVTRNAAQALGMHGRVGVIRANCVANLCRWKADSLAEIVYLPCENKLVERVFKGKRYEMATYSA